MRHWLCAILFLWVAAVASVAATRAETRAFETARKAFDDGVWDRADRELGTFLQKYPQSEHRAQAALFQARARCELKDYSGAIELLTAELPGAGALADQFTFWTGEAQFSNSNYTAAAAAYRTVVHDFTQSSLRLEAAVNEAAAWSRLNNWERVEELISQPAGVFQQLAATAPPNELVARGLLLLAEARLARGSLAAAEEGLRKLDERGLHPALAWRRMFLLCRALVGRERAQQALLNTSNLVALAQATAQPKLIAESYALQAGALEELGQLENAAATYARNLVPEAPVKLQQQALLKLGELALVRGRLEEAAQQLEDFLRRHPDSPASDMALLALGELYLKQHVLSAATPTPTNLLQIAQTSFDALRTQFPQSPLLGRAQLNRGWCFWLTTNLAESATAFASAAEILPPSLDQALARLKLADAQYQLGQFAPAIANYNLVVAAGSTRPDVRTNLCEPALYQIVVAANAITNAPAARDAVGKLLDWFPGSYVTESGLLMAGQGLTQQGNPAEARAIFQNFLTRFPASEHAAPVQLAVARTYELEPNWPAAVRQYESWLTAHPTNAERPRAEYALALASYQAGDETNALTHFTNFLSLYVTNELAPQAQWWVADYHFRHGELVEAEKNYQFLFLTWPGSPLAFEARMMAGRTAMARQGWDSARDYFTNLTSNPNCPADLKIQAIFAYGDALRRTVSSETNNPANLEEAIKVFRKIHDLNATNAAAARAWGEIGNCHLQLAAQDPAQYTNAAAAFAQVTHAPAADVAARSQAQVALGIVAEKLAAREAGDAQTRLLRQALNHYLDVFYETHLREGELPDLFWLKRAGLDAARVAESLGDWTPALRIYQSLQTHLPPLRTALDKKIEKARERLTP